MPDTELMDEVLAIITEVPALHNQSTLVSTLSEAGRRVVRAQLDQAPAEAAGLVPDCGSTHCVAGWVLVLRGYRYDTTTWPIGRWVGPDGVRLVSPNLLAMAAHVLRIPLAEAYDDHRRTGIFWDDTSLEEIRLWVAFYKGEIDRDDLEFRLGLKSDA